MPTGGRLRLLKGVLYRLKRSYGCPISVYRQSPQTIDFATGKSTITRTSVDIRLAIVLPSKMHREFSYHGGFTTANSNFLYGGIFTDSTRQMIIDRVDLPKDWVLRATDEWYITYMGDRWELKAVEAFEVNYGYLITLDRVEGAVNNKTENVIISDHLDFDDELELVSPELDILRPSTTLSFTQSAVVNFIIHNQSTGDELSLTEGIDDEL